MSEPSPEAVIAARRIVPQYVTCGSIHVNTGYMWSRWQCEVEEPTNQAAVIIQQAIDAVVAKSK